MSTDIQIIEVGPRDGLQNEAVTLSTDDKLTLIDHLVDSGVTRIEVVSFAHPKYVPQLADAEAVMARIDKCENVSYIGLVMNWRGWLRALDVVRAITEDAHKHEISVTATIGTAWGCPFEGEVPIERLVETAAALADSGIDELAIADTIGVADPWSVTSRLAAVAAVVPDIALRVNFHDTRNTGLANTYAAIEAGVTRIDASVGGIGGCPFAPAATGNIATDDLVYMLNRGGFEHGISLSQLIGVSGEVEHMIERPVPAMLPAAGNFPPSPTR